MKWFDTHEVVIKARGEQSVTSKATGKELLQKTAGPAEPATAVNTRLQIVDNHFAKHNKDRAEAFGLNIVMVGYDGYEIGPGASLAREKGADEMDGEEEFGKGVVMIGYDGHEIGPGASLARENGVEGEEIDGGWEIVEEGGNE